MIFQFSYKKSAPLMMLAVAAPLFFWGFVFIVYTYANAEQVGDITLQTGDATSDVTAVNEVTTNTVETSAPEVGEKSVEQISEGTQSPLPEDDQKTKETLEVANANEAVAENEITADAQTGDNAASADDGFVSVDTGDAYASANITNIVNSNFVGSEGYFQLLNYFGNLFGDISLMPASNPSCSFFCFLTQLLVQNQNSGTVLNDISVFASTGGNRATSTEGDASINTGNAFAAANSINMVNTNVIGSDYLAFIMNAFGSWEGDLELPPGSFFEELDSNCLLCAADVTEIGNTNSAAIENSLISDASSGANEVVTPGGGDGSITTGSAISASNVLSIANTNVFGNNLMLMYVRTLGNWRGRVFSLPKGITVVRTEGGFIIDGFSSGVIGKTGIGGAWATTTVANTNSAFIKNAISASALTGGNKASGALRAGITTGNAFAATNVINIANTNIMGRNWILAVINIFGDWVGDVAFGRPNLWIGASAEGPSTLGEGSLSDITLSYRNNGNSPATDAVLTADIGEYMRVVDARGGVVDHDKKTITWSLGAVAPGVSGSVSYRAQVDNAPAGDSENVVLASATLYEDDASSLDNTDELRLDIYKKPRESYLGASQIYARLEIKKERRGVGIALAGSDVAYAVTVVNKGAGQAYHVVVEDDITDSEGETINSQSWDLDTVYPGEEIMIDYTIQFASSTPEGMYTNAALARWYDENGNYVDHSGHASAAVAIMPLRTAEEEETTVE